MRIINLIDEDFVNYKKPSMFIGCGQCDFKCDRECGRPVCQNSELAKSKGFELYNGEILERYCDNPITEAVVFGGLEPFYSEKDVESLTNFILGIMALYGFGRIKYKTDIVIYTGYYPDEVKSYLDYIRKNIGIVPHPEAVDVIIKFGRFIPDRPSKYDELLGVELASDNQYAMRLEDCFK